jgi:hypothetical protein
MVLQTQEEIFHQDSFNVCFINKVCLSSVADVAGGDEKHETVID